MRHLTRIFKYVFRYPVLFGLCMIFAITFVTGKVSGVLQFGNFFSTAFVEKNLANISPLFVLGLVGAALLWAGSHYCIYVASNTLSARVMHDLRQDVYEKLVDQPVSYFKGSGTGDIMSRLLNDMSVIEIFLMNIMVELIAQPLTVVAIVAIMIVTNPVISAWFFSIAPVIAIVLGGIGGLVQNLSMRVQKNIANITNSIQETVAGIEVIKGFGVEEDTKDRFRARNDNYLGSLRKEIRVRFMGTPSAEFLGAGALIVILVLGSVSVAKGMAKPEDIVRFIVLALVLAEPLAMASNIFMVLKKLSPAAARIFEVIDSVDGEKHDLPPIGDLEGAIEFRDVSFSYNGSRKNLDHVQLTAGKGETLAIVGHSGAGKSTLVSLVPAFYQAQEGCVLLDGRNVAAHDPRTIRKQIGIVTQDPVLFAGSIAENLRLSRPGATMDEVIEAAKLANAHDFVTRLPDGYETLLGDRGARISGGERQRLALARAILRRPRILILDEATSSLDAESEHLVQQAMQNILGRQTTLIVAHKLSTIMHADRIVVVEDGKITETGSHEELLHQGGIYRRLFGLQVEV